MMPLNVYVYKTYNTINTNITDNMKKNNLQNKINGTMFQLKNQINHVGKNIFLKKKLEF